MSKESSIRISSEYRRHLNILKQKLEKDTIEDTIKELEKKAGISNGG